MTIDTAWLSANAWWLLAAGAAAWWYLSKNGGPAVKLPAITVRLADDQIEQLRGES